MILMERNNRKKFLSEIQDAKYRRETVSASIDVGLAFQINRSREQRKWSTQELASKSGVSETTIADLEDPNSEKHDLMPLLKIAAALDVALLVRLVPFSSMVEWEADLSESKLTPCNYAEDVKAIQRAEEEDSRSFTSKLVDSLMQSTLITAQDISNHGRFEGQRRLHGYPRRHSYSAC